MLQWSPGARLRQQPLLWHARLRRILQNLLRGTAARQRQLYALLWSDALRYPNANMLPKESALQRQQQPLLWRDALRHQLIREVLQRCVEVLLLLTDKRSPALFRFAVQVHPRHRIDTRSVYSNEVKPEQ